MFFYSLHLKKKIPRWRAMLTAFNFSDFKHFISYLITQIIVIRNIYLCFKRHFQFFKDLVSKTLGFAVGKHEGSTVNVWALTNPAWIPMTICRQGWNLRCDQESTFQQCSFKQLLFSCDFWPELLCHCLLHHQLLLSEMWIGIYSQVFCLLWHIKLQASYIISKK